MDSELRQRLKMALPMPEKGQEEFQAETGIDIEHDIDYVVAAMTTSAGGVTPDRSGMVVARGRFERRSSRPWRVSTAAPSRNIGASGS